MSTAKPGRVAEVALSPRAKTASRDAAARRKDGGAMAEGADDRKAQLRDRLARGREAFLAAVTALDDDALARLVWADGGTWTARDLIGHVSFTEGSMLGLIRATLAGAPPQADPAFDLDRFNEGRVQRARGQELAELLARLDASRAETLALLDSVSAADLGRAAYHPVLKETTVEGIFRVIAFHERLHAKDLLAVKGAGDPAPA